jgi:hypothetical protein
MNVLKKSNFYSDCLPCDLVIRLLALALPDALSGRLARAEGCGEGCAAGGSN